ELRAAAVAPVLVITALALLFIIARWATRVYILHHVGPEDFILTASMLVSIGMTAVITARTKKSSSASLISSMQSVPSLQRYLLISSNILYHATVNLTKTSIVTQYCRIFWGCPIVQGWCYALYGLLTLAALWGIAGGGTVCVPIAKYWSMDIEGTCMSFNVYWLTSAGVNLLADLIIWILPMPVVKQLQLPKRQMNTVLVIFGLGGTVCVVATLRLTLVQAFSGRKEGTNAGVAAVVWSAVEANVGIICASLISLKPLVQRFFPRLLLKRPRVA
ncbi:hypothetical protein P152DRAFT_382571, partial [Eremomyces bilateralis CBS 781.70]